MLGYRLLKVFPAYLTTAHCFTIPISDTSLGDTGHTLHEREHGIAPRSHQKINALPNSQTADLEIGSLSKRMEITIHQRSAQYPQRRQPGTKLEIAPRAS